MRLFGGLLFLIVITACVPAPPNSVVQELELANLKMAAVLGQSVAIESAYKRKDIVKTPDLGDKNATMTLSSKFVEPFQGCARFNAAYRYTKTGFFSTEKKYDFIFKVCEQDQELYSVELIHPDVPGLTGITDLIDVRRTAFYLKQGP